MKNNAQRFPLLGANLYYLALYDTKGQQGVNVGGPVPGCEAAFCSISLGSDWNAVLLTPRILLSQFKRGRAATTLTRAGFAAAHAKACPEQPQATNWSVKNAQSCGLYQADSVD